MAPLYLGIQTITNKGNYKVTKHCICNHWNQLKMACFVITRYHTKRQWSKYRIHSAFDLTKDTPCPPHVWTVLCVFPFVNIKWPRYDKTALCITIPSWYRSFVFEIKPIIVISRRLHMIIHSTHVFGGNFRFNYLIKVCLFIAGCCIYS